MKVSVCIPTYNGGELLGESIRSALAQTRPPDEIIVVDDGSTDHTAEVCASFGPAVRYVRQENDGTMGGGARQRAFSEATGDWLALLDHDDLWLPDKLEKQLRAAEAAPELGAVFTRYRNVDERGRPLPGADAGEHLGERLYSAEDVFHLLLTQNPFCPSSALVRREAVAPHLLTDMKTVGCGDWELWFTVAQRHPVLVLGEVLTEYRFLPTQFCANKHKLAVTMRQTLSAQRARFHPGCARCEESFAEGMAHVSDVFAVAARSYLDECHASARVGRLSDALASLRGAVSAAPREVLRPRRAAALLKSVAAGVTGGGRPRRRRERGAAE
ncbi:MAG TPA: glycosyltransferase family 2 protein [Pyrinomonadaceae bacterium]|nr:glycosyltransferase family 2 protein [Pyrinomonadaceae bacterium]